ncbi:MAG: DUF502 domain-containing protein [Planctomycetes bacterium]|nr:DUF502 domain-containing protein [Planctomycetota bacterium]
MKTLFKKGLGALLPTVLTILILYLIVGIVITYLGIPIGRFLQWAAVQSTGIPAEQLQARGGALGWFMTYGAPVAGFVLGVALVFFVGAVVATFFGRRLVSFFERLLLGLPVIKVIYPYAKQATEFFFSGDRTMELRQPVAVPYPRPGVYSIGFIMSEGLRSLNEATQKHLACVFIPASPLPYTGFLVYVPREEILPLALTADEALRIVISVGILTPPHQTVSLAAFTAAQTGKRPPPLSSP